MYLLFLCVFLCLQDLKAVREEGQVPVRWCKFWSARHPTPHRPSPQEEVNIQPWLSPFSHLVHPWSAVMATPVTSPVE